MVWSSISVTFSWINFGLSSDMLFTVSFPVVSFGPIHIYLKIQRGEQNSIVRFRHELCNENQTLKT
jgi:hypothetical protein